MLFKELRKTRRWDRIDTILDVFIKLGVTIEIIRTFINLIFLSCGYNSPILNSDIMRIGLFGLTVLLIFFRFFTYKNVIKGNEFLLEFSNLIEESYSSITIKEYMDTNIRNFSINDFIGLKENNGLKLMAVFRNDLINYSDLQKEGFNEDDDIIMKISARISLLLSAMIRCPLIKASILEMELFDYSSKAQNINFILMEKVLKNFMLKFSYYIDIEKINKADWDWYFYIATTLPKYEVYNYIYVTLVYDVINRK